MKKDIYNSFLPPIELPACVKANNRPGLHKITVLYACRYCLFIIYRKIRIKSSENEHLKKST